MRKLLTAALVLALSTPSFANVLVRTNPSLSEIQAGIDACRRGDEDNCKYERYAGVARRTENGGVILPASNAFLLGRELREGTVLPRIDDRKALLRKLKDREVEVHSFLAVDSPVLLASTDAGQFLQRYAVIVPTHIAELARQNGVAPHEMLLHIETNWEGDPQDAQELINEHTALVLEIAGNLVVVDEEDINVKIEELENLKEVLEGLEASSALASVQLEALQGVIDSLEEELGELTADRLLELLVADGLRKNLEELINADFDQIRKYIAGEEVDLVGNRLWTIAQERAAEAAALVEAPGLTAEELQDARRVFIAHLAIHGYNTQTNNSEQNAIQKYIDGELTWEQLALDPIHWMNADTLLRNAFGGTWQDIVNDIYQDAYDEGYEDGYRDGYADGFRDGVNSVTDTLGG